MDRNELITNIIAYAENDEQTFVDTIPAFVRQAERRVFNTVQHPAMRTSESMLMSVGVDTVALPSDHLWTYAVAILHEGVQYPLLPKDQSFIREAYPAAGRRAMPKVYAHTDDGQMMVGPSPDQAYALRIDYYRYPPSIMDAGTSWLGDNYDQVLLYGSLIEAYTFMKGEVEMLAVYKARYDEAMLQLKQVGDGKLQFDSYRNGQLRMPIN